MYLSTVGKPKSEQQETGVIVVLRLNNTYFGDSLMYMVFAWSKQHEQAKALVTFVSSLSSLW